MAVGGGPKAARIHAGAIDPELPAAQRQDSAAKRPDIKITASRPESRFVGPIPMAIGLVALAAIVGFAIRASGKADDPNFLRAKESLSLYEAGRPEIERNYDSEIYANALADLGRVAPDSISVGPAAELVADIQFRTDAFHRRVRAQEAHNSEILDERRNRDKEFQAAHQRNLLMPRKDFPECKEDGHPHAK
jgi:hypothetical protein